LLSETPELECVAAPGARLQDKAAPVSSDVLIFL